jgi:hypothetical protein
MAEDYLSEVSEGDTDSVSAEEMLLSEDDLSEESEGDTASMSAKEMSLTEDDLSEESEDMAGGSADEEMSLSEPGLDFDDYESDWFILRTKLWRVLGYGKDRFIHDKIQNMWQTNLEIETIGWPVVPLEAFSDPDAHSTTANCLR